MLQKLFPRTEAEAEVSELTVNEDGELIIKDEEENIGEEEQVNEEETSAEGNEEET
jgi:hypothetical protein